MRYRTLKELADAIRDSREKTPSAWSYDKEVVTVYEKPLEWTDDKDPDGGEELFSMDSRDFIDEALRVLGVKIY